MLKQKLIVNDGGKVVFVESIDKQSVLCLMFGRAIIGVGAIQPAKPVQQNKTRRATLHNTTPRMGPYGEG